MGRMGRACWRRGRAWGLESYPFPLLCPAFVSCQSWAHCLLWVLLPVPLWTTDSTPVGSHSSIESMPIALSIFQVTLESTLNPEIQHCSCSTEEAGYCVSHWGICMYPRSLSPRQRFQPSEKFLVSTFSTESLISRLSKLLP